MGTPAASADRLAARYTPDRLQHIADYVRDCDFSSLRRDAEDVARRHPLAFYGGMLVAGLLLGNLVKASRRRLEDDRDYSAEDETAWAHGAAEDETPPPVLSAEERAAAGI